MEPINYQQIKTWELDQNNKPKNETEFLDKMLYLFFNDEWTRDETAAKKYSDLLIKTDISELKEYDGACKAQAMLIDKYPDLFSLLTVSIGGIKESIPKACLSKRSEKFDKMLKSGNVKEVTENKVSLTAPNHIQEDVLKNFLNYIKHGKIELTGDNVLPLLSLAQEHLVGGLSLRCIKFLANNLGVDNFDEILKFANDYSISDLKWQCLADAYTNYKNEQFKKFIDNKETSIEAKELFQLGCQCQELKIKPIYSDEGEITLLLPDANKNFDEEDLDEQKCLNLVKDLNNVCQITKLDIEGSIFSASDPFEDDMIEKKSEKLNQLFSSLPSLKHLVTPQRVLPDNWLKQLVTLEAKNLGSVSSLNLPNAKSINIRATEIKNSLKAPKAEKITILGGAGIEKIESPNANYINYISVMDLKRIDAPKAESITVKYCNKVIEIESPNVKTIECIFLKELKNINTSNTTQITVTLCPELLKIDAPLAKKVDLSANEKLETLYIPNAESLEIEDCNQLKSLTIKKGCKVEGLIPEKCKITYS